MASKALELDLITQEELNTLIEAEAARNEAIQVDDFTLEEYMEGAAKKKDEAVTERDATRGDGAGGHGAAIRPRTTSV